jgi:hypothetical protein
MVVETAQPSAFMSRASKEGGHVHVHPVLLPAPTLLQRARLPGSHNHHHHNHHQQPEEHSNNEQAACVNLLDAPHARSMLWAPLESDTTSPSAAASVPARGLIAESQPVPADGRAVPGRPFINVVVPLAPPARHSWPNISSPDRPWRALLSTSVPKTAEGQPVFQDQSQYLQYSLDMNSNEVTRVGLAIPYSQPGAPLSL